ncbi:MAG: hypothetical protein JXR94_13460 [Candidatus Hydrogenedentes bacterium]|nr:hypothetical protein [Candidatus Hydrogenedentota bacterium]
MAGHGEDVRQPGTGAQAGPGEVHFLGPIRALQAGVLALLGVGLFLAVLTAPVYEARWGGVLGARGVWLVSLILVLIAAQRAWLCSSSLGAAGNGSGEPGVRRAPWTRFLFFCLFLLFVNRFVHDVRGPDHWGLVAGHDQPQYYAYLHSWVFDRDLDFENEYRAIPAAFELMAEAHPGQPGYNVAPVGTAVLWLPFYLAAHGGVLLLRALGLELPCDGLAAPYAMAAAFGSICLAWLGALMTHSALRRYATPRSALFAVLLVWLASPLPWYLDDQPWMSHAASFFAAALVFWLWERSRRHGGVGGRALLGLGIGLAMLVRPSHVVLAILPAFDAAGLCRTREGRRAAAAGTALCVAGLAVAFTPQVIVWLLRYGPAWPQGSPMQWAAPAVVEVLFSAHHGLFAWHPVLALGFLGVPLLWRRARPLALRLAVLLAAYVYVTAAIATWYAGGSFGMRRFVGVLPFLAPGIAAFGSWAVGACKKRPAVPVAAAVAGLFVYNSLLAVQFREAWNSFLRPVSFQSVWTATATLFHERFGNPFTYPASLAFGVEHGVTPGQYDVAGGGVVSPELDVSGIAQQPYLGRGWYTGSRCAFLFHGAFPARDRHCTLLIPLEPERAYIIELTLSGPHELAQGQTFAYGLNGTALGTAALAPGAPVSVSIHVPPDCVVEGVNTVELDFAGLFVKHPRAQRPDDPGRGLEVKTRRPLRIAANLSRIAVRYAEE